MTQFEAALTAFHGDLDRSVDLLNLIQTFRRFAGANSAMQAGTGAEHWPAAQELFGIAPKVRTDLPILSGAIQLYLSGRFEFFVREIVTIVADDLVESSGAYSDLPDSFQEAMFSRTLEVAKNSAKYGYDRNESAQMLKSLSTALTSAAGQEFSVDTRPIAITENNMNASTMADIFKRVGVTQIWQEIGKQAPLKSYLSESEDGPCRTAATSRLDGIMKERNAIAHPTADTSFPDPEQVKLNVGFFRVLSRVVVDLVQVPRGSRSASRS